MSQCVLCSWPLLGLMKTLYPASSHHFWHDDCTKLDQSTKSGHNLRRLWLQELSCCSRSVTIFQLAPGNTRDQAWLLFHHCSSQMINWIGIWKIGWDILHTHTWAGDDFSCFLCLFDAQVLSDCNKSSSVLVGWWPNLQAEETQKINCCFRFSFGSLSDFEYEPHLLQPTPQSEGSQWRHSC